MGKFNLIVQHPKPKKPVHGVLSMDRHGEAQFFAGNGEADSRIVGTLERARVEHISSDGILISGIERSGGKLRFQEWWLVYTQSAVGCQGLAESRVLHEGWFSELK